MKVGIGVMTDTWIEEEGEVGGGEWSYRGATDGKIIEVSAYADSKCGVPYWSDGFELDVKRGDTVYPVVVTYGTGDTFGRKGGQTVVMDVFATDAEALELVHWIHEKARVDYRRNGIYAFREKFGDKDYHMPWRGYFEWFQNVGVYPCMVK